MFELSQQSTTQDDDLFKLSKRPYHWRMFLTRDRQTPTPRGTGGRFMISGCTVSTPKLCAGGPSISILIHKICIGFKGFSNPTYSGQRQ